MGTPPQKIISAPWTSHRKPVYRAHLVCSQPPPSPPLRIVRCGPIASARNTWPSPSLRPARRDNRHHTNTPSRALRRAPFYRNPSPCAALCCLPPAARPQHSALPQHAHTTTTTNSRVAPAALRPPCARGYSALHQHQINSRVAPAAVRPPCPASPSPPSIATPAAHRAAPQSLASLPPPSGRRPPHPKVSRRCRCRSPQPPRPTALHRKVSSCFRSRLAAISR